MTQEKIGSMNDFAAEHGLDPRSTEATVGYTALLTENYRSIRDGEVPQSLQIDTAGQDDAVTMEVK